LPTLSTKKARVLGRIAPQQVRRAAVDLARHHDVVAAAQHVEQRQRGRGLPAGGRDGGDAALEVRDALLRHRGGRVAHPRVAEALDVVEQELRGGLLGAVVDEARGREDRRRPRPGPGVG
jgi:hypothetical protein